MYESRGQSETVGVVLLTAVIVTVTVVAGAFILADFQSRAEDTPNVDIESSVTAEKIELQHRGGDSFDPAQISVIVRDDGGERRYTLASDFNETSGDGDTFAPGQRWRRDMLATGDTLRGTVTLLVVDEDSNELLHESTHVVGPNDRNTNLMVDSLTADDPVTEGQQLPINVTTTNTGDDTTAGQSLTVEIVDNGTVVESFTEAVTVDSGDTETKTFSYTTENGDTPELTITATTEDDPTGEGTTATVEDSTPGGSDLLGITEGDRSVDVGDEFDQHLTYGNPETGHGTVLLRVVGNGTDPDSTETEIAPGEEITPTEVGFPEQGVILDITDDTDNLEVTVEIGDQ